MSVVDFYMCENEKFRNTDYTLNIYGTTKFVLHKLVKIGKNKEKQTEI